MSLKDPNVVNSRKTKRVAIVLANPAVSATTGWPVGFWWSELSHPYFFLTEKGYAVDIFSPNGGRCEADAMSDPRDPSGYSASDIVSLGFLSTPPLAGLLETTRKVAAIDLRNRYVIIEDHDGEAVEMRVLSDEVMTSLKIGERVLVTYVEAYIRPLGRQATVHAPAHPRR